MKPIIGNVAFWFLLVGFSFYWVLAAFVPPPPLKHIFDGLACGMAIMIVLTWAPAAARAMRQGATTGEWQLVIAVFFTWLILILQRSYILTLTIMEKAGWPDARDWLVESSISGFIPYSITVAGLLYLISASTAQRETSPKNFYPVIGAVGIGSMISGIMIGSYLTS